jgi:hypothetical protein
MQRSLALVVLVVLALAGALIFFLSRGDVAPTPSVRTLQ